MTEKSGVEAANKAFYEAFQTMDLKVMEGCWSKRDQDICIHPGWEVLWGWEAISESWMAIFENSAYMRFEISDLAIECHGEFARVTCLENIYSVVEEATTHAQVAATNLYLKTDDGWRLTLHHGSPVAHTVSFQEDEEFN